MRGSGRKYGVQVGNETYSLIMTQDDWEKRRLDREHARKLSLATNKRRRALDDRKRLAEMRENRKRELELFKRRQRQIEATERYQRFHINIKDRRDRTTELTQTTPNLDLVLQKLRGGDGDGTPAAYEMLPPPMHDRTSLYSDTESKLQQRAKWQKDYSTELNRDIFGLKHIEGESISKDDSYLQGDNDDGQDSLHGSTISGSSSQPSLSSVNCTNDANTVNISLQHRENSPMQNSNKVTISQSQVEENQHMNTRVSNASGSNLIPTSGSGVMCKRDTQTGKITYYVKAYRPWSAGVTNKPQAIFNRPSDAIRIRPNSSYEARRSALNETPENTQKQHDITWTNAGYVVHSKQTRVPSTHQKPVMTPQRVVATAATSYIDIKPNQTRALILGKTTATPVSPYFDNNSDKNGSANFTYNVNENHQRQNIQASSDNRKSIPTNNDQILQNAISILGPEPRGSTSDITQSVSHKKEDTNALKGILRRYSKYDTSPIPQHIIYPQPAYQSATLARQKWLHGINIGPASPVDSENNKEQRTRSAEVKSVRWHQVQYNDGTSSALDGETGRPIPQPPTMAPMSTQITPAPPRNVKSPRKSVANRPKTSPPRTVRGGKGKGGRKLRVAKETPVDVKPHPPPPPLKNSPKLSMSTVINYSIDPTENAKQPNGSIKTPGATVTKKAVVRNRHTNGHKRTSPVSHNKILFHRKVKPESDVVTMSTLKSSGTESQQNGTNDIGNVVVNEGNQVTISVSSSKPIHYGSNRRGSADVTGRIPLNGTPTDQEIDMLWDKVRAYLAWNKNRNTPPATKKYKSPAERKVAWGSAQPAPPTKNISANIISIDGGIFSKNSQFDENSNFDSQPYNKNSQQIAAQMERYGIAKSRKVSNSYSPAMQVYDFNNYASPYQRQEKVRGAIPIVTNGHPSSAPIRRQAQLTESVKTFRLVEALIEQNVPEEQILRALNSLQTATREV